MSIEHPKERLVTTTEVARLFRVDAKTVNRWAQRGKLRSVRTPGGRLRFYASEIRAIVGEAAMR